MLGYGIGSEGHVVRDLKENIYDATPKGSQEIVEPKY